jgi:formiminotetrahydrofolate cyclodeaminase
MSIKSKKVDEFLEELADSKPTPGGGAAAALVGSMAASLVEMVAGLTVGRKGYEKVQEDVRRLRNRAIRNKKKLLDLADKDVAAFNGVVRAYKLRKDLQPALRKATEVPLETAETAKQVLALAEEVVKKGNKHAISDAKSARYLARAAILSALENVKINLKTIEDPDFKEKIDLAVARLKQS